MADSAAAPRDSLARDRLHREVANEPLTADAERRRLAGAYRRVRADSLALPSACRPRGHVVQSMPDASPTKCIWAIPHGSFEKPWCCPQHAAGYAVRSRLRLSLQAATYESLGSPGTQGRRAEMLSRAGRRRGAAPIATNVDAAMSRFFERAGGREPSRPRPSLDRIGTEPTKQQAQELILTRPAACFGLNPTDPAYAPDAPAPAGPSPIRRRELDRTSGGLVDSRHADRLRLRQRKVRATKVWLSRSACGVRPVPQRRLAFAFMADGGYARAGSSGVRPAARRGQCGRVAGARCIGRSGYGAWWQSSA